MQSPAMTYFLLASHRSGSSLLCDLLTKTGIAGQPAEYFMHWRGFSHSGWDINDYPAYTQRIFDETSSANGVWGVKLMGGMVGGIQGFLTRLETFPMFRELTDTEKVRAIFPNLRCIYLSRRNKIAQAVSWWKAVQNEHYHSTSEKGMPVTPLSYDFAAIDHLISEIMIQEAAHQAFLDDMGMTAYNIFYEDFIQDMAGTLKGILEFLGIQESYSYQPSHLTKMQDALSDEWIQRYRKEKQASWEHIRW
jgi:trehalose 2-sulfotransferase